MIIFILTFLISGLVAATCLRALFYRRRILDQQEILLSGFICGPVITSAIYTFFLVVLPKQSPGLYCLLMLLVFVLPAAILFRHLKAVSCNLAHDLRCSLNLRKHLLFKLFVILFAGHILYQGICLPIVTNDAIIYSYIGRYVAQEKSLANYPMKKPDPATGAFFPWASHPPALISLYSWLHLFDTPETATDLPCRAVAPVYALYLLGLLYYLVKKNSNIIAAQLSTILYAFMPVFLFQTVGNFIDPLRISLLTLAVISLYKFIKASSIRTAFYLAVTVGLTLFIHIANFILLPVCGLIFLLLHPAVKFKKTIIFILVLIGVGVQFFVWNATHQHNKLQYLLSLNPVHNINDIRRRQAFGHEWQQKVSNKQVSTLQIIWHERLQFYSMPDKFGLTFFCGTLGIFFFLMRKRKRQFSLLFLLSALFTGFPLVVKYYLNYRYITTIAPQIIYFGSIFLAAVYLLVKRRLPQVKYLYQAGLLAVLLFYCAVFYTGISYNNFNAISGQNPLTRNFLKFAAWKAFTNPMVELTCEAAKVNKENHKLLITSNRLLPEHFYYYAPAPMLALEPSSPLLPLFNSNSQQLLKALQQQNIHFILATPPYSKLLKTFIGTGQLKVIRTSRGYNLYQITD